MVSKTGTGGDPAILDWANLTLPDSWADGLDFRRPRDWLRFAACVFGRRRRPVAVPESAPGQASIPKYVLQEFHGLPNGNYSKRITRGYITGFDHSMLGAMAPARQRIADNLRVCRSVLDAGCAGGRTARTLQEAGIAEVWGLDPSPYLLQHAAMDYPGIRFVQGLAESTGFPAARFDGIAACFLLHEIPPKYVRRVLAEFHRILKPGGLVAICEPSPVQWTTGAWRLWRRYGWSGLYFRWVARFVHEPFLAAWHKVATPALFAEHGFEILEDDVGLPLRHLLLRRKES